MNVFFNSRVSTLSAAVALGLAGVPAFAALTEVTVTDESLEELCRRNALSQDELATLRDSGIFVDLLEFTLEYCPDVAAILTEGATAVVPEIVEDEGEN